MKPCEECLVRTMCRFPCEKFNIEDYDLLELIKTDAGRQRAGRHCIMNKIVFSHSIGASRTILIDMEGTVIWNYRKEKGMFREYIDIDGKKGAVSWSSR